jgi:hypothetical protein
MSRIPNTGKNTSSLNHRRVNIIVAIKSGIRIRRAQSTHLHVSKGIVVFSGAERMELVAGAEEALHHDSVGRGRAHVVLTQELQQVLVVVPCTPEGGYLTGCRQCQCCGSASGTERRYFGV